MRASPSHPLRQKNERPLFWGLLFFSPSEVWDLIRAHPSGLCITRGQPGVFDDASVESLAQRADSP